MKRMANNELGGVDLAISSVTIRKNINGLQPMQMDALNSTIVIAGENGSGKSRLAKLIEKQLTDNKLVDEDGCIEISLKDNIEVEQVNVINYSPFDISLQSPDSFPPYVLSKSEENLKTCNFENTARDVLLYLEHIFRQNDVAQQVRINLYIEKFLGETIEFPEPNETDVTPTFFGLPYANAKLSPGQEYLLRMCVALSCNRVDANTILIIDEPEVHLHPVALTKLIRELQDNFKVAQIWILTHSLSLVSSSNLADVWFMEKGTVSKLRSNSENLIQGLLGGDDGRKALQDFIVAPDAFACNEFAARCLLPPSTKTSKSEDPQVKLIVDYISQLENVIAVDYGAGKGRLLEGITIDNPNIMNKLDYYAYNKYIDDYVDCKNTFERCGQKAEGHCFFEAEGLKELKNSIEGTAHIVFLVNVLHEIAIDEWKETFDNICSILCETGYLIIVEQEELTFGEKPNDTGFVVITEGAARSIAQNVNTERFEKKKIVLHAIPKTDLQNVTEEQIGMMIKIINEDAEREIREIRNCIHEEGVPYKEGLRHAFWTFQLANTHLYLKDNGG
jgi:predicted ATPase